MGSKDKQLAPPLTRPNGVQHKESKPPRWCRCPRACPRAVPHSSLSSALVGVRISQALGQCDQFPPRRDDLWFDGGHHDLLRSLVCLVIERHDAHWEVIFGDALVRGDGLRCCRSDGISRDEVPCHDGVAMFFSGSRGRRHYTSRTGGGRGARREGDGERMAGKGRGEARRGALRVVDEVPVSRGEKRDVLVGDGKGCDHGKEFGFGARGPRSKDRLPMPEKVPNRQETPRDTHISICITSKCERGQKCA